MHFGIFVGLGAVLNILFWMAVLLVAGWLLYAVFFTELGLWVLGLGAVALFAKWVIGHK